MVTYTDKVVGKIVDKLDELGLRENTLIIFTGDNGVYHGLESKFEGETYIGGKGSPKDNGTHVPLIVNWPGTTPGGRVSQSLVDFSDMLPTIAEAAGIEVPADWGGDGVSFAPEIRGESASPREWIYCWYQRDGVRDKASQHVRNQRFKLYASGDFFDVVADFGEANALATDMLSEKDRAVYRKLKKVLAEKVKITEAADPGIEEKRAVMSRGTKKKADAARKKKEKAGK